MPVDTGAGMAVRRGRLCHGWELASRPMESCRYVGESIGVIEPYKAPACRALRISDQIINRKEIYAQLRGLAGAVQSSRGLPPKAKRPGARPGRLIGVDRRARSYSAATIARMVSGWRAETTERARICTTCTASRWAPSWI